MIQLESFSQSIVELIGQLQRINDELLTLETNSDIERKAVRLVDQQTKTSIADLFILSETLKELADSEDAEDIETVLDVMENDFDESFEEGYN